MFFKKEIKNIVFSVPDMHCGHCSAKIEGAVKAVKGVKKVAADPATKEVKVEFDALKCTESAIRDAVLAAGFTVND